MSEVQYEFMGLHPVKTTHYNRKSHDSCNEYAQIFTYADTVLFYVRNIPARTNNS